MNLYSKSFPIKPENEDGYKDNSFEFKAPYTITGVLYTNDSHYIGYNVTDSDDISVDVLNIIELRDYVKAYPKEFTNAKISKTGHLEIDKLNQLPHHSKIWYNGMYVSQGLIDMLEVKEDIKVYDYAIKHDSVRCTLNADYKNYLKTTTETEIVFPPLLTKFDNNPKLICDCLFACLDLTGKVVDFSLVDFSYYEGFNALFEQTKIDKLDFKFFDINKHISLNNLFINFQCDNLNLNDCDFSNIKGFERCFKNAKINKLTTEGCILNDELLKTVTASYMFGKSQINYLDLSLFENIPPTSFIDGSNTVKNTSVFEAYNKVDKSIPGNLVKFAQEERERILRGISSEDEDDYKLFEGNDGWFKDITCRELVNIDKLPLQMVTDLELFFDDLKIVELDISNMRLDSLVNFDKLFAGLKCDNLKFNPNLFAQAETAQHLFEHCEYSLDLDFSDVEFTNLTEEGAYQMFASIYIFGTLTLPKSFGNAQNFDDLMRTTCAEKIVLSHCDFSNATSMNRFFFNTNISKGVTFPKNKKFIPRNLVEWEYMFNGTSTPFINLRGFDFQLDVIDISHLPYLTGIKTIKLSNDSKLGKACLKDKTIIEKYNSKVSNGNLDLKLKDKREVDRGIYTFGYYEPNPKKVSVNDIFDGVEYRNKF